MVGTTLVEIRDHIDALASDDGDYYVVCGRTDDRPVPAAGKRFDGRATARSAARATEQYRTALRRYDPRVPYYDLIVCQDTDPVTDSERCRAQSKESHRRTLTAPVLDGGASTPERHDLVEFCHRVAGAVFETLSEAGYDAVESAVMDAYVELAETVDDPDELCLCLLESTATELDDRLDATEQTEVLADAADRLGPIETTEKPLTATLAALEARGVIGSYTRSPWSVDLDGDARSVVVRLSDYTLAPRAGRLPVLPIVLELYRRQHDQPPLSIRVVDRDGGWRVEFVLADAVEPAGLASAPIDSEV